MTIETLNKAVSLNNAIKHIDDFLKEYDALKIKHADDYDILLSIYNPTNNNPYKPLVFFNVFPDQFQNDFINFLKSKKLEYENQLAEL